MAIFNRILNKFKFIHSADIHLESQLSIASLGQMPEAMRKVISEASKKAFFNLVNTCIEKSVDFLIISGDLFDFSERTLSAQVFAREQFDRLNEENIRVYITAGNHDCLEAKYTEIKWPPNVIWFGSEVEEVSLIKNAEEIAEICGISFLQKAERANLSLKFKNISTDLFAIGILQTNLQGSSGHLNYAPCTKGDLEACCLDYWALGHVHSRIIVKAQNPAIVYPGNTQARGFYESGEKGCYLVDVIGHRINEMQFIPIDSVRFEELSLEVSNISSIDEMLDTIEFMLKGLNEDRLDLIVVKLNVKGNCKFKLDLKDMDDILHVLRRRIVDAFNTKIWVDSLAKTVLYDINEIDLAQGFAGAYIKALDETTITSKILDEALAPIIANNSLSRYFDGFTESDLMKVLEKAKSLGVELIIREDGELCK